MTAVVVVNDPVNGQTVAPKAHVEGVLALMPAGGKQEWRCGKGCYGFVVCSGGPLSETPTVWVIETECADIRKIPRELVREALYR